MRCSAASASTRAISRARRSAASASTRASSRACCIAASACSRSSSLLRRNSTSASMRPTSAARMSLSSRGASIDTAFHSASTGPSTTFAIACTRTYSAAASAMPIFRASVSSPAGSCGMSSVRIWVAPDVTERSCVTISVRCSCGKSRPSRTTSGVCWVIATMAACAESTSCSCAPSFVRTREVSGAAWDASGSIASTKLIMCGSGEALQLECRKIRRET